jgi:hypothetical protein
MVPISSVEVPLYCFFVLVSVADGALEATSAKVPLCCFFVLVSSRSTLGTDSLGGNKVRG